MYLIVSKIIMSKDRNKAVGLKRDEKNIRKGVN